MNVPGTEQNFAEHLKGKRHESNVAAIKIRATLPSSNSTCDPKRIINHNSIPVIENADNAQISDGDDNLSTNRKISDGNSRSFSDVFRTHDDNDKLLKSFVENTPEPTSKTLKMASLHHGASSNETGKVECVNEEYVFIKLTYPSFQWRKHPKIMRQCH